MTVVVFACCKAITANVLSDGKKPAVPHLPSLCLDELLPSFSRPPRSLWTLHSFMLLLQRQSTEAGVL